MLFSLKEFEPNVIKRAYLRIWLVYRYTINAIRYKIDMIRYKEYFKEMEDKYMEEAF